MRIVKVHDAGYEDVYFNVLLRFGKLSGRVALHDSRSNGPFLWSIASPRPDGL